jgi:hypothetical protein
MLMSNLDVIYTSDYCPDPTSTLDVLSFLMVPEWLFTADLDAHGKHEVEEVLRKAKREALLEWYKSHIKAR